jgi:hypothetical protein
MLKVRIKINVEEFRVMTHGFYYVCAMFYIFLESILALCIPRD